MSRALAITGLAVLTALPAQAEPNRSDHDQRHVLLISVDGLHASDLQQWTSAHPNSTLARLQRVGTTYAEAHASQPSDSFPGLLAMLTGGTPRSTGVFYDDAYAFQALTTKPGPITPGSTTCWQATPSPTALVIRSRMRARPI